MPPAKASAGAARALAQRVIAPAAAPVVSLVVDPPAQRMTKAMQSHLRAPRSHPRAAQDPPLAGPLRREVAQGEIAAPGQEAPGGPAVRRHLGLRVDPLALPAARSAGHLDRPVLAEAAAEGLRVAVPAATGDYII